MTRVLYPGSFDPITKGHMDIIHQASELFDEVLVAVMQNPAKKNFMFSPEERVKMIQELYQRTENVKVILGSGATVDVALLNECKAIVRGLRSLHDFDDEIQLATINKEISNNKINTVCFFANPEFQFTSSSMVKELLRIDKDISKYVDPYVKEKLLLLK